MRSIAMFVAVLFALPMFAQVPPGGGIPGSEPSPSKESFAVLPPTVAKGDQNVEIRIVNNTPAGFSHSSSRAPELKVGAGATLVSGSFAILNTNEAKANLNIEQDTASTIELQTLIYAVNGTTVLRTFQATLGVTGAFSVAGSSASVGADDVTLVVMNSKDDQSAGSIRITGSISGTVSVTAPTGCNFVTTPSAASTGADINSPALTQTDSVFSFSIGNANGDDITVLITGIQYNTEFFSLIGGVDGDLALEITGGALSNQTALVVNAFTAKSTIDGENDTVDQPAEPTAESESSEESESSTPASSTTNSRSNGSGNRRNLDSNNRNNNNRNASNNSRNTNTGRRSTPAPTVIKRSAGGFRPVVRNNRNGSRVGLSRRPGGAKSLPVGTGGASSGVADGYSDISTADASENTSGNRLNTEVVPARKLITSPGLYFTNKSYEPITAMVMNRIVSDEAGGRIWVVLMKTKNDTAKIETVTVKLTVGGSSRSLKLTETSKDSGLFRCNASGVLVVSKEDPDSNRETPRKSEPKPRFVK